MQKKLRWFEITALYIGVIMGAGFASGRECWQFFGVFGAQGYKGIILVVIGFIAVACMLCTIARKKNTNDLGKLISPTDNKLVTDVIGITMAAILYSMIVAMTAAGGSLLHQQFGINKAIGGAVIAVLVVITVLGDFERLSKVFRLLVPVLFVIGIATIILVIRADFPQSGATSGFEPGRMSPNWVISAGVFLAYNSLGMITMAGSSAVNAKDNRNAYTGAVIGCICLGGLTILLLRAMLTDMAFSCSLDLPMLGFSEKISSALNIVYAIVLFGSIYSTAASTYYGFSTKLPNNRYKKSIIIAGAVLGFALGLTGFRNLVEFLYPAQGYIGILFLILIIINFAEVLHGTEDKKTTA